MVNIIKLFFFVVLLFTYRNILLLTFIYSLIHLLF